METQYQTTMLCEFLEFLRYHGSSIYPVFISFSFTKNTSTSKFLKFSSVLVLRFSNFLAAKNPKKDIKQLYHSDKAETNLDYFQSIGFESLDVESFRRFRKIRFKICKLNVLRFHDKINAYSR